MTDKNTTITVAVVSPVCQIADVAANLAHFESWVVRAVEQDARLVFFPELALSGYAHNPDVTLNVAEPIPGPATRALEVPASGQGERT